jgi:hypothetical protein
MVIAGKLLLHFPAYRPSMAIKKPRIRFRVRGFWILRLVQLRRALTRTSVGNEKYEDENGERDCARIDEPGNQCGLAVRGLAAGAVAVRHAVDPNRAKPACQHLFSHMSRNRRSPTARPLFGRLDVRTRSRPLPITWPKAKD